MRWRERASSPWLWIGAWLVLLIPVWLRGVVGGGMMRAWVRTTHPMCAGLPPYGEAARLLPAGPDPVDFTTDAPEPAGAERLFCAQYQLAPRVLARWRPEARDRKGRTPPAGESLAPRRAVIVHVDEPSARQAVVAELSAEAVRHGSAVELTALPGGLLLVSFPTRSGSPHRL